MEKLSPALEDYLESIVSLDHGNGVRITDIADNLGVTKPSASKAIVALKERGFATQEHYGPVQLTPAGRNEAELILEKHAAIKIFLQGFLGIDESTADQDACLIEHALSPQTLSSLMEFLASNGDIIEANKPQNS